MRPLDELLRDLVQLAATPLGRATAMPAEMYRRADVLEIEREWIFGRAWVSPGLAADLPDAGSYLTFSINDQPVFVIRGHDGEIRSFSNVCRHRMMRLVEDRGTCRTIVCPYHGWSYDLQGALLGAPHVKQAPGFEPASFCLPAVRTEIWEGWIYITLDADAASIGTQLAPLRQLVAPYAMASYVPVVTRDWVWNTNWKLLTENFMESYHLPVAHRKTLGPWCPFEDIEFPAEVHEAFTYETFTKDETARYGRAHPANARLEGRWRYTTVMPTVYPTHMYVCAPDHVWYLSLRPKTAGEILVRFGAALAPEVFAALDDRDGYVREMVAFFERVNEEDRFVVEALYAGSGAPLARPGPLTWLERELHDFIGYLARRLTASPALHPDRRHAHAAS